MPTIQPRPAIYVNATAPFDFVFGRFNLSTQWAIPYFATTMTMRQAAESLRLVSDFPGSESLAWKIDELYQRDIDWFRVEKEIVPYLASTEEPQFFNSLTIALMPIRDNEAKTSFEGEGWQCPETIGEFPKRLAVGPISIGYWGEWTSIEEASARIGQIRWNPQQVFSVAIDGQHRLAALKVKSKGFDAQADRTLVPVLLLLLDPRVGFRAPTNKKLVDVMRTLFITLNKHAETVSRPRQILLDDEDPHALCVRALVGEQITDGTQDLEKGQLPLSLVDWHREQAKIDDGPYITTILGLDWIVEKTLRSKPIKDYSSYSAVNRQLRAISLSLRLNLHRPDSPTFTRLKEIEDNAIEPFAYLGFWSPSSHDGELGQIVEAFRAIWAKALIEVLTTFQPYAALIARRRADGNLCKEFVNWYYLLRRKEQGGERANDEYSNFVDRLKNRSERPINTKLFVDGSDRLQSLKTDNLAFKVAFQRALILAFLEFATIDSRDLPDIESEDDDDGEEVDEDASEEPEEAEASESETNDSGALNLDRARQFVHGLNELVGKAPEFLDVKGAFGATYIWQGALYNRVDDTIDFTLGASKRAADLVFIAAALSLCKQTNDESVKSGFRSFWGVLEESDVGVHKKLWKTIIRRYGDQKGAGGRIVLGRDDAFTDEAAIEEAKIRAAWVWDKLGLPPDEQRRRRR